MKASQIVVVLSSVLVACVVVVVDAGTNKSIAPTPTVTRPGTMPPVGGSGTPPPVATDTAAHHALPHRGDRWHSRAGEVSSFPTIYSFDILYILFHSLLSYYLS